MSEVWTLAGFSAQGNTRQKSASAGQSFCLEALPNLTFKAHSHYWQNSGLHSCRTEIPFPCWLSIGSHPQLIDMACIRCYMAPSVIKARDGEYPSCPISGIFQSPSLLCLLFLDPDIKDFWG